MKTRIEQMNAITQTTESTFLVPVFIVIHSLERLNKATNAIDDKRFQTRAELTFVPASVMGLPHTTTAYTAGRQ